MNATRYTSIPAILALVGLIACGGATTDGSNASELSKRRSQPGSITSISVQDASVTASQSVQMIVNVTATGALDKSVTWTVDSASIGTIDAATGLYTAPSTAGIYKVWATSNADSTKAAYGSVTVSPSTSSSTVNTSSVSAPSISSFAASPSSITQGASASLSWTASGATSLSIDNGVGVVTGLTSASVTPSATTTYTLTATSSAGSVTAKTTVTVSAPATVTSSTGIGGCTALVSDSSYRTTSPLSKPNYLQTVTDPDFGTAITRISGDPGTTIPVIGGTWPSAVGTEYSKVAVWNADASILMLNRTSTGGPIFLNGSTYAPIRRGWPQHSDSDFRWHPTNKDVMLMFPSDGTVWAWNFPNNTYTQLFNSGLSLSNGGLNWEGNVSADGNFAVINATYNGHPVFFAVDLRSGSRISEIFYADSGEFWSSPNSHGNWLDWASISPLGNYIVATRDSTISVVISFTGSSHSKVGQFASDHYDLGVLPDGTTQVAYNYRGQIFTLPSGSEINLAVLTGAGDGHASARDLSERGWGYSSLIQPNGIMEGEIIAQELKPSGQLRRLGHHRVNMTTGGNEPTYDRMPFHVPSPDGLRVVFQSDWGNGSGPVEAYVIDVRGICP